MLKKYVVVLLNIYVIYFTINLFIQFIFFRYLANNFELYFTGDYFNPNNQLEGETKE